MDWRGVTFDWNRARAFLVTAEEGSLSAAARALGLAQPTLGRQVRALEDELGVALFERGARGLELTPAGLELVEHARAMGEAAGRVSLAATGRSQSVEGRVTVTASEALSAFVLPPILTRLRAEAPGLVVELVAADDIRDLRRREADIALRSVRPADPELTARRLGGRAARLYAAESYLARAGPFDTPEALSRADFIGFPRNEPYLEALNGLGLSLTARNFPMICDSHLAQWALVKAGAGIGAMILEAGEAEPGIRPAAPWLPDFRYELWLVAHRELRTSRRVRLVFDRLAEALGA
jgi:DNA-binding transcriptional LysR family regulator